MKQYVVDQLNQDDIQKLRSHLEESYGKPEFDSIFWLPIKKSSLNEVQQKHVDCHPFMVAVDLQESQLVCELLIRTQNKMRCECMGYANRQQRNDLIELIDSILEKLGIII